MAIIRHLWDFGDGETSTEENPRHLYKMAGVYTVTHTVFDDRGNTSSTTGTVIVREWGDVNVSRTNTSYRYAVTPSQGIGYSKNTGDSWPLPESRVGALTIIDDSDVPHTLVLDNRDGMFWDISTRDSYSGSGLTKVWNDKVAYNGVDGVGATGGTAVVPKVRFAEDRGTFEHYFIEHIKSNTYFRPDDEANRGASGYDANGYQSGTEITSKIYADGEPTLETSSAEDIGIKGDIHYDKTVRAHRLQGEISVNNSEIHLLARQSYYKAQDVPPAPDERITTENDYQTDIANATLWYSRGSNLLLDRVSGVVASGTVSSTTGPDTNSGSAMSFTSALTLTSVTMSSGMLLLWHQSLTSVEIGGADVTSSLVTVTTSGDWTLSKLAGYSGSGAIVITPDTTGIVFDIRVYASNLSSGALTYYSNDILNNSGNSVCPLF